MAQPRRADDTGFDVALLQSYAGRCRFTERVLWFERVDSTNERARRLGRAGAAHGTLVVAGEQTAGRGRRRRTWESPPGGLYCSLLLRGAEDVATYSAAVQLAAGVAVAETLAGWTDAPLELLWPNDCLCRGQKIAGVLVEAETTSGRLDFLVCGMGVNLDVDPRRLSPGTARAATSLARCCPCPPRREELLARLMVGFEAWEAVAARAGVAPLARRFEELSPAARGARVSVETTHGTVEGVTDGLAPDGGLRLRTESGAVHVFTGELVRVWRRT